VWFVQNHFRDLWAGYDHLLRYLGAAQAIIAYSADAFRRCYGPEYVSGRLQTWAEKAGICLLYIQPGDPQQNAYIERYNRTVRTEWLGRYHFESIEDVQDHATKWLWTYNNERPNMGIGGMTPIQKLKAALILLKSPSKNGGLPLLFTHLKL